MKRILTLVVPFVILILISINTVFAESPIKERPDLKVYIDGKLGVYCL